VKIETVITVTRDVGCLVVGLGGIIFQQVTGHVNIELLIVYTTFLGVPGVFGLLSLRGKSTTSESSSPSQDSSHSQVSS
jgi:hypothetical protein